MASLSLVITGNTGTSITIGETSILTAGDNGNGGQLIVQPAILSAQAALQSLSFYVTTAAGNLVLGIYASNSSGLPGSLVAQTAEFAPKTGWNTAVTTTTPTLAAGTYWLCYFPSSSTLAFVKQDGVGTTAYSKKTTFTATLPATYPSGASTTATVWSIYATLSTIPVTPAVISVNLSPTTLVIPTTGADAGDIVGSVTVTTTPGYNPSAVTLGGPNASLFALTNSGIVPCHLIVGPSNIARGSYSITLSAS